MRGVVGRHASCLSHVARGAAGSGL
jgi:hypothetical protein